MQVKVFSLTQTKPGDKQEEPTELLLPQSYCSFFFPVSRRWQEALFQNKPGRPNLQSSVEQLGRQNRIGHNIMNNRRSLGLLGNCGNVWAENRLFVTTSARQTSTQRHVPTWGKLLAATVGSSGVQIFTWRKRNDMRALDSYTWYLTDSYNKVNDMKSRCLMWPILFSQ